MSYDAVDPKNYRGDGQPEQEAEKPAFGLYEALDELAKVANMIATQKGFTDASPAEDIALMHSELSEGLEDMRANKPLDKIHYTKKINGTFVDENGGHGGMTVEIEASGFSNKDGSYNKPCGVPSELADIVIRVLHFCGKHKVPLAQAVKEKMMYNMTRPYKHGGKKL